MNNKIFQVFLIVCFALSSSTQINAQQKIPLYTSNQDCDINKNDRIVESDGSTYIYEVEYPEIWYYPAKNKDLNKPAVMVIPGGAYRFLSITNEGISIAKWLNELGVDAFMLKHRLPNNYDGPCKQTVASTDAFRAIELIRDNSDKWNIDPNNVGVIGFSAGGHLASTISTKGKLGLNKPNFAILVYPVITMNIEVQKNGSGTFNSLFGDNPDVNIIQDYSNDLNVNQETPPTILIHSNNDEGTPPENSISYYAALRDNNIPSSLHIWEDGGHGYGLAKNRGTIESWTKIVKNWLTLRGVIN
jgi:acetyl esterase/lipase